MIMIKWHSIVVIVASINLGNVTTMASNIAHLYTWHSHTYGVTSVILFF